MMLVDRVARFEAHAMKPIFRRIQLIIMLASRLDAYILRYCAYDDDTTAVLKLKSELSQGPALQCTTWPFS